MYRCRHGSASNSVKSPKLRKQGPSAQDLEPCNLPRVVTLHFFKRFSETRGRVYEKTRTLSNDRYASTGTDGAHCQLSNPVTRRGGPACAGTKLYANHQEDSLQRHNRCIWLRAGMGAQVLARLLRRPPLWMPTLLLSY
jgi:hypothetical protein